MGKEEAGQGSIDRESGERLDVAPSRDSQLSALFAKEAELRALVNLDLEDRATWPESMRLVKAHEATLQGGWEASTIDGWPGVRLLTIEEAVTRGTAKESALVSTLVEALGARLVKGSIEWRLLRRLQDAAGDEALQTMRICHDVIPALWRLLPFESIEELLAALSSTVS